jgi:PelA/Pel-15E family pectate lyase
VIRSFLIAAAAWTLCLAAPAPAKVIGTMSPADAVREARVAALPEPERVPWTAYWKQSQVRMAADKAALAAERKGLATIPAGPPNGSTKSMPLDRPSDWYGSAEARHIADNIVSFQSPAAGWGKNQDRSGPLRVRGQSYVIVDKAPPTAVTDAKGDNGWTYVGTIDNGATTTELRFLARVQQAFPGPHGPAYRAAFLKGLLYLLEAQYPNGGWPQIYPLEGGYHDAVTFNDDAMTHVVELLADVAAKRDEYAFVPDALAAQSRVALDRAVALILRTQIVVGGKRTGWAQQYDALTLAPAGARNFEPAALSSNESAALLAFLMRLPSPSPEVVRAVQDGVAWLKEAALRDVEWTAAGPEGRRLVPKPGAGPLWARYYDIATMRPIFGDRDKTIHDDVNDLSVERRNGYSWFGSGPARALRLYERWATDHPH